MSMKYFTCKQCGKQIYAHSKLNRKFCDKDCLYKFQTGENNPFNIKMKDPEFRAKHSKAVSNGMLSSPKAKLHNCKLNASRKGKTYIEMYGVERAKQIKDKFRKTLQHVYETTDLRERMSVLSSGENNPMFGKIAYPKLTYHPELQHSTRSNWEYHICKLLYDNNIKYEYELKVFKVKLAAKNVTYRPDIHIVDTNIFIEVKGPIFDWQIEKMKAFKEQYSDLLFVAITNPRRNNYDKLSFCDAILDYDKTLKTGGDELLSLCSVA